MGNGFDIEKISGEIDTLASELHGQFLEMSQIKSNFDSEKFTVGKEGGFIASQFHFLMRQYRFAIEEMRRMYLEYEKAKREIKLLVAEQRRRNDGRQYITNAASNAERLRSIEYLDLEILQQQSRMRSIEIDMQGKMFTIRHFEKLRKRLIELNGDFPPTNEQYQEEQVRYYEWFLAKSALQQIQSKLTGISEGVLEAYRMSASHPILTENMQVTPLMTEKGEICIDRLHERAIGIDTGLLKLNNGPK